MFRLAVIAFLFLTSPVLAVEDGEHLVYGYQTVPESWDKFTVRYPAGRWNVTKEVDGNRATFRLESRSVDKIVLQLFFTRGLPKEDAHYDNNPQLVNDAALLPIALAMAGKDESKIVLSVGTVALPEFVGTSSRATVLLEDNRTANLEACNFLVRDEQQSSVALGVVITESVRGQVRQDPEYIQRIAEAYAIIQAIEVAQAETTP